MRLPTSSALVLILTLGCRPFELTPEQAREVELHAKRVSGLRPELDTRERVILEAWFGDFLHTAVHWHGDSVLPALKPCDTIGDYISELQRVSGRHWDRLVRRSLALLERQARGESEVHENRKTLIDRTPRFQFITLEGTRAHEHVDLLAEVSQQAWVTAMDMMGVQADDVAAAPRLVMIDDGGGCTATESRLPMYLAPSRRAWPEGAYTHPHQGVTRPQPRRKNPGGELDLNLTCSVVYLNSLSLLTVAHEIAHAVSVLAFADWPAVRADDSCVSDLRLRRKLWNSIPPPLWNEGLREGPANAVAARVPLLRRSLLLDKAREDLKARARRGATPWVRDLHRNPYSDWNTDFCDFLATTFGGEGIRRLLKSGESSLQGAVREAFGRTLDDIEEAWRKGLLE